MVQQVATAQEQGLITLTSSRPMLRVQPKQLPLVGRSSSRSLSSICTTKHGPGTQTPATRLVYLDCASHGSVVVICWPRTETGVQAPALDTTGTVPPPCSRCASPPRLLTLCRILHRRRHFPASCLSVTPCTSRTKAVISCRPVGRRTSCLFFAFFPSL